MNVLLILSVSIVTYSGAVDIQSSLNTALNNLNGDDKSTNQGARSQRVSSAPLIPKKDPWLTPNEGILANEHTQVYWIKRGPEKEVSFEEIPRAIEDIVLPTMNSEKYQRASVENLNNADRHEHSGSAPVSATAEQPKVLYPRIMVVVSHELYLKLGANLTEILPYMLAYWNGVDLLYRSIENPKIRLNIAKIIIEAEENVLEYLIPCPGRIEYWHANSIKNAYSFWLYRDEIPPESYDIAVTMTTRSFYFKSGGTTFGGLARRAYFTYGDYTHVLVKDDGMLTSITTAAHELGHTLGMEHDRYMQNLRFLSEIRNTPSCLNVSSNYLMDNYRARDRGTSYKLRWSQCSLEQLDDFIRTTNLTCMYNPPKPGKIHIPRLLPGKLISTDEHCKSKGYGRAHRNYDPCQQLICQKGRRNYRVVMNVPEGTPCDGRAPDKFCLFGECVSPSAFT